MKKKKENEKKKKKKKRTKQGKLQSLKVTSDLIKTSLSSATQVRIHEIVTNKQSSIDNRQRDLIWLQSKLYQRN